MKEITAMPIVTIYRGASGSGQELAEAVAKELRYRCISREVLVEASRKYGIPQAKLKEIVEKGQPWLERILENLVPYRIALQAAFCELVQGKNIVYHGHIGHELIPKIKHVLKVLLTAARRYMLKSTEPARAGSWPCSTPTGAIRAATIWCSILIE